MSRYTLLSTGLLMGLLIAPQSVSAEDIVAPLNVLIAGSISVSGEVDRYSFTGKAGRTVTVSSYFGKTDSGSVLRQGGGMRLIGPDGAVLASPENGQVFSHNIQKCRWQYGKCWPYNVPHYDVYSVLDEFVLPETGTYFVEIAHTGQGTGKYWLGISDPLERFESLSVTVPTEGEFGVRGDVQEWEFLATAGETVAWTYQGHEIQRWMIMDAGGTVVAGGTGGDLVAMAFTPVQSGVHRLVFEDVKDSALHSFSDIGPFVYRLNPAAVASMDQRIDGDISVAREVDLYDFRGEAGRTVTVSSYFGKTDSGSVLRQGGGMRLIGPDGAVLASPENGQVFSHNIQKCRWQYGKCWPYNVPHYDVYSVLDEFVLPETGTYFVEIAHTGQGTGKYWLGISDPSPDPSPLPITELTEAAFGVRGSSALWEFQAAQGQPLAWAYSGERPLASWHVTGPGEAEVASSTGGSPVIISFSPSQSGRHQLVLNAARGPINSPSSIGPFPYTLFPDEDNKEPIDPLLLQYAPILHIFADDFRPKVVESMVEESVFIFDDGITFPKPTTIEILESEERKPSEFMNMSGATAGFLPIIPNVERFNKYETAIYGRSFLNTPTPNEVSNLSRLIGGQEYRILQYWLFYPYNNFVYRDIHGNDQPGNHHEGDWEMIQIIVDPAMNDPLYATYSWHWAGTTLRWPEDLLLEGDHPRLFVGKGSHSSWNEGGVNFYEFLGSLGQNVILPDIFVARGDITPEIGQIGEVRLHSSDTAISCPGTCETYDLLLVPPSDRSIANDWNSFPGKWGELGSTVGSTGPDSPRFLAYGLLAPINRWTDPIAWANDPTPAGWDATANSPVDLSVFDSQGNRVGIFPSGETQIDIPGTYFFSPSDDGPEWVTILTDDQLTFRINGTGDGTMDLSIARFGLDVEAAVESVFEGVPITSSFISFVQPDGNAPSNVMQIDSDGDGTIDRLFLEGEFSSLEEAIEALPIEALMKEKEQLLTPLLNKAEAVSRMIAEGNYAEALTKLTDDMSKHTEQWLVDVPAEEGRATKQQVLQLIDILIAELQALQ